MKRPLLICSPTDLQSLNCLSRDRAAGLQHDWEGTDVGTGRYGTEGGPGSSERCLTSWQLGGCGRICWDRKSTRSSLGRKTTEEPLEEQLCSEGQKKSLWMDAKRRPISAHDRECFKTELCENGQAAKANKVHSCYKGYSGRAWMTIWQGVENQAPKQSGIRWVLLRLVPHGRGSFINRVAMALSSRPSDGSPTPIRQEENSNTRPCPSGFSLPPSLLSLQCSPPPVHNPPISSPPWAPAGSWCG